MKRLLFVTTANLASNPRLYKEIRLAEKLGHEITYIAFKQGGWSDEKEKSLKTSIPAQSIYLSALRSSFLPWFVSSLLQRVFRWMWLILKDHLYVSAIAHNKRTYQILRVLKRESRPFDLIIGHNLGALYPAWIFSKHRNIPFAFDVEDYHPGEASTLNDQNEIKRRKQLLGVLLQNASYYSYASPMIGQYVADLMLPSLFSRRLLINNCFSKHEFSVPEGSSNGKLRMVWFSQNINYGRGLEWVLPMLDKFKHSIQLSLIGKLNAVFGHEHLSGRAYVEVISPMSSSNLNASLVQYDVGLALELDETDLNRQLCLTNKIWAYLQAGLFILATDTPAQQLFMSEHPLRGLLVTQNMDSVHLAIEKILSMKDQIRRDAFYRYEKNQDFSWEVECVKLEQMWREVLN